MILTNSSTVIESFNTTKVDLGQKGNSQNDRRTGDSESALDVGLRLGLGLIGLAVVSPALHPIHE